jgi:hypothetical protein
MEPPAPPKVVAVEVVAAQPTEADKAAIAHLSVRDRKALAEVAYVVKIRFESMPEATSRGWALYVDDFRIPKYWAYKEGVFFKIFDPQFFQDHREQSLRFSENGVDFVDTGLKLAPPRLGVERIAKDLSKLPSQDDVLK